MNFRLHRDFCHMIALLNKDVHLISTETGGGGGGVTAYVTTDKQERICNSITSLSLRRLRDLNRGSMGFWFRER